MAGTILCVDDDRHFCQILSRALSQSGWQVETVHDGERALGRVRELSPGARHARRDAAALRRLHRAGDPAARWSARRDARRCSSRAARSRRRTSSAARALGAAAVLQKPVPLDQLLASGRQARGAARSRAPRGGDAADGRDRRPARGSALRRPAPSPARPARERRARARERQEEEAGPAARRRPDGGALQPGARDARAAPALASGKITPDVLHESLMRSQRGEGMVGQILVAMHMLDEEDLAVALHRQADEKLLEVFGWETGSSKFHPGTRIKGTAQHAGASSAAPPSLILEGVRHAHAAAAIDRYLAGTRGSARRARREPLLSVSRRSSSRSRSARCSSGSTGASASARSREAASRCAARSTR